MYHHGKDLTRADGDGGLASAGEAGEGDGGLELELSAYIVQDNEGTLLLVGLLGNFAARNVAFVHLLAKLGVVGRVGISLGGRLLSNWRETLLSKGFWLEFWWRWVVDGVRPAGAKAAAKPTGRRNSDAVRFWWREVVDDGRPVGAKAAAKPTRRRKSAAMRSEVGHRTDE